MDVRKQTIEADWESYAKLISEQVKTFHQGIANRYHPHTYVFYGDDAAHKTWGNVVWQRNTHGIPSQQPATAVVNASASDGGRGMITDFRVDQRISPLSNVRDVPKHFDSGQGRIDVMNQRPFEQASFQIKDASENGDGTVPIRSGSASSLYAPRGRIKVCIGYPGIDHEGAYKNEPQRWFAVWAITKIVQNVRGTALDYPDPPAAAAADTTEITA